MTNTMSIWVCDNPKQRVLCKQKYNAPSPSPFPFSHHGQASNSRACPWVRKGEGGRGWGIVFAAHTQWAAPVGSGREQKIGEHSGIFFVNLISTTVRHPIDDKHTEHWGCGNPKQRVLCKQKHPMPPYPPPSTNPQFSFFCNISWGASAPQTPPRPLACVAFL